MKYGKDCLWKCQRLKGHEEYILTRWNGMAEGQGGDMAEVWLLSISLMPSEAYEKQWYRFYSNWIQKPIGLKVSEPL